VRKDTLGAGDAFASGFTSAIILGESLKRALTYGTLNANSVVNFYGAQQGLLTRAEMKKRLKTIELQVTSTELLR
ncbi:carbohydrate kinase family protein, partial [Candidatus Peregrinibacteria bacterium]|nr:carbohydrate kinase family protein [Candidatus Peregrinibacteria bacterium]